MTTGTHAQLPADHRIRRTRPFLAHIAKPANPPMGEGHNDDRLAVDLDRRVAAIAAHDARVHELVTALNDQRRARRNTRQGAPSAPRGNQGPARSFAADAPPHPGHPAEELAAHVA